jgi:hypothetical protein
MPDTSSIVVAAISAVVGSMLTVAAIGAWDAYDDNEAAPAVTNVAPGSGVTSDAIQPSGREGAGSRHFTGRTGHVDSDPSVLLDFWTGAERSQ